MADSDNLMTPSGDHEAMAPFWAMIEAILGGAETMRAAVRSQTKYIPGPAQPVALLNELQRTAVAITWNESPYLPRFPNEQPFDYELRRRHAPFTNIYADIGDNLASKPFSKTLELDEDEPDNLKTIAENIDGQGNNLHVFARKAFRSGIDKFIHWILVDYTNVPQGATLADERSIGARPYWVSIEPERMLANYSAFVNGQEVIYYARIHEPIKRKSGYGEVMVDRVRVLNREPILDPITNEPIGFGPPTWQVYELINTTGDDGKEKANWLVVASGEITIGVIPLVAFIPAGRNGCSWQGRAPLHDLAYMQIEEFQQESNLKSIKEMTAYPMLAGNGVQGADAQGQQIIVPVGPRAVLFAPPGTDGTHGEWKFIEPTGASLNFLQSDLEKLRTEMRNLGRQPLTTTNLTVVTTANVAMKAHNAVQAWSLMLKDALEQAWVLTCKWLNIDAQPQVNIHTDFGVDFEAGTELDALLKGQAQGILSKETIQSEFKRRGVLSDDFDPEEEAQQLAEEEQGLQPEQAIDPVTGEPIEPSTRPKVVTPPTDNVIPMPKRKSNPIAAFKKAQNG
jgi:hypothetical protein